MRVLFFLLIILINRIAWADNGVVLYPAEPSAARSSVFSVQVNGKEAFTQKFKDIHYVRFAHKSKVTVLITCLESIQKIEVSPKNDLVIQQQKAGQLILQLSRPGYHVITLNDKERLFILSDHLDSAYIPAGKKVVNVLSFGVDNTGQTLTTASIQRALNETAGKGKTLYFPPGIYRTGTIRIRGNSDIYIGAGALIRGSENRDDYPADEGRKESDHVNDKPNYTDNGEWMTFSRLILIDSAVNVKLRGQGIIDGSGSIIRAQGKPANLIRIRNSKNVTIEGLLLRDPACWNTHILFSENVTIRNIKMINDRSVANTDGFDPDASKNVLINHCFAYCSDDNIAIKTTNNSGLLQNCENVTVSNCVFLTKKSSLKIGTETKGAYMRNILFKNNYVVEADRGLVLYCYDGARFHNIRFINNYFEKGYPDNQKKAIHFQIRKRNGEGEIKNVLIRDCTFSEAFHSASEITGLDSLHTVDGIKFKNVILAGKPCLSVQDLNLKTNEYVQNISFEK